MSTTVLEPPIRVFKLSSEGTKKASPRFPRINTIYDLQGNAGELDLIKESSFLEKQSFYGRDMAIHDTVSSVIGAIREPIAEIQEKRGISKNQKYTFLDLLSSLFQNSYHAIFCMISMVLGLLPLVEGLLTLIRFTLDKILEINDTTNPGEKCVKSIVFLGELLIMCVLVALILTIILFPVFHLVSYCLLCVWSILL